MKNLKNIHIVKETITPEDGERYSNIIKVFAYKSDATKFIKKLMIEYIHDEELDGYDNVDQASTQQNIKTIIYGQTGKYSGRGKFWMRPDWSIETYKLTPKSTK